MAYTVVFLLCGEPLRLGGGGMRTIWAVGLVALGACGSEPAPCGLVHGNYEWTSRRTGGTCPPQDPGVVPTYWDETVDTPDAHFSWDVSADGCSADLYYWQNLYTSTGEYYGRDTFIGTFHQEDGPALLRGTVQVEQEDEVETICFGTYEVTAIEL